MKLYIFLNVLFLSIIPALADEPFYFANDTASLQNIEISGIVVSSSRSETKLRELPVAVSVVNNATIVRNDVANLNQLGALVPNVSMPEYGSRLTSPVYIRGIGSRINNPSIGLYVDNIPFFEKSAFNFDFFDIERVEILRGPQGTLYGRNSMGGLINVVTRHPMRYQGTDVRLTAGNYGVYSANVSHHAKVGNKFAWSLSANTLHQDGFFTNEYSGAKIAKLNSYGLRNRLVYQLTDNMTIENVAAFEQSVQDGYPYAVYDDSAGVTEPINYNQPSSYDRTMFSDGLSLRFAGKGWEFTNTLSYQYIDDSQKVDQDFTEDSSYFVVQDQNQQMLANEWVARSNGKGWYRWLVGAFGFMQEVGSTVSLEDYARSMYYTKGYDYSLIGGAIFHQSVFVPVKWLEITAGLRYDYEKNLLHYTYSGTRAGNPLPAVDTTYPHFADERLIPKLSIAFLFGKSSVYISNSQGYKPGGYNSTFESPEQLTFDSETSQNIEVGTKLSLIGDNIYIDAAIFKTLLTNQQIYRTVPSGRGSYLDNAGKSENKGFEMSATNRSWHGFEASLAYGYTFSEILEYVKDTIVNYNHKMNPYIPRQTFSAQVSKTFNISGVYLLEKVIVSASGSINGVLYWDLNNELREDPYKLINAKVALARKNFRLEFWGRNLLDQKYHTFVFEALNRTYAQYGKPLQLGVSLAAHF